MKRYELQYSKEAFKELKKLDNNFELIKQRDSNNMFTNALKVRFLEGVAGADVPRWQGHAM